MMVFQVEEIRVFEPSSAQHPHYVTPLYTCPHDLSKQSSQPMELTDDCTGMKKTFLLFLMIFSLCLCLHVSLSLSPSLCLSVSVSLSLSLSLSLSFDYCGITCENRFEMCIYL